MPIALVGSPVVPTGNPTTGFTVVIPSQVQAGHGLYLALGSRDSTGAGTLAVTDNDTGGFAWLKIGNSTDHKISLWYKQATSATASKTITVANAVGSSSGVLKCFSGISTGFPYGQITVETNASGDETHAGFTPARANAMICAIVVNYANDNAVTALNFATAGATTFTEKLSTGGNDCATAFGHVLQSGGPTATGNLTWAQTDGTTYSLTFVINEPPVLTAAGTSYTWTRTAATLRASRKLIAASTSYAQAATAATLKFTRAIIAAGTSYAWTRSDADLVYTPSGGYTLTADPGSYTWTRPAATLRANRRIAADATTYAQSGTAATFRAARTLIAASTSYAWTGTNVGLNRVQRLVADVGSYAQTTTAAGLRYNRRLDALGGVYTVSGTSAALTYARRLVALATSYAWTMTDATLRKGISLLADAGVYAWSPSAATFRVSRVLAAAPTAYAWTGASADLSVRGEIIDAEREYAIDVAGLTPRSISRAELTAAVIRQAQITNPTLATAPRRPT